jgi:hypothetical protein
MRKLRDCKTIVKKEEIRKVLLQNTRKKKLSVYECMDKLEELEEALFYMQGVIRGVLRIKRKELEDEFSFSVHSLAYRKQLTYRTYRKISSVYMKAIMLLDTVTTEEMNSIINISELVRELHYKEQVKQRIKNNRLLVRYLIGNQRKTRGVKYRYKKICRNMNKDIKEIRDELMNMTRREKRIMNELFRKKASSILRYIDRAEISVGYNTINLMRIKEMIKQVKETAYGYY